jgi:hypothetical protein
MKSLVNQELMVARKELRKATAAIDALKAQDAKRHLCQARCAIEVVIDLLSSQPPKSTRQ